ncbi:MULTISPECIES: hypothetical protein [Deinococcus]|jgi:predicted transcriptional regulator|uniref:HTH cro/C1-type domain-containing protein n=3 Tax=Deinococcus TaxID=1298 RepID=A0A117DMQ1_9DEIO|nr:MULTISPECIES: hypothetical protein [Deinococcus]MXV21443.1 XRE family transcriptional regulator [Deinococcus xianganensis]NTY00578.1 XRE family transcriptional regulator [Deinococcus sp. JMULE3]RIY06917.1 XRE family transcriptional regulator [Deinococcus sp. RM]BBN96136.1 helix-turn-helix domain-containing protein [Deinococcus grandis]GAQ20382.1 hypothetical protein DEIGR_100409 [Deinococcus grandis]
MDTVTFPGGVKLGARRRLLGIPLAQLARDAALQPELLRRLEAGEFDPRSLHRLARQVLSRTLDTTLD